MMTIPPEFDPPSYPQNELCPKVSAICTLVACELGYDKSQHKSHMLDGLWKAITMGMESSS